jgi:hypothetical protein
MTRQNAALVEQSAAAADMLKDQASRLDAAVQHFALSEAADAARADTLGFTDAGRAPRDVNPDSAADAASQSDWARLAKAS